ncbi:endolytic transglycosylase MltG [Paratractidigestivibacter sp.]|uniref:endolytic transglycosylase MltG n=1 Tax=Paratractidigestivibacter sp. TaxID=2847316 RepID=UPI002ABD6664|nr:endolytic transglycosylase MltG [Paratractidigestivibacter sp.]
MTTSNYQQPPSRSAHFSTPASSSSASESSQASSSGRLDSSDSGQQPAQPQADQTAQPQAVAAQEAQPQADQAAQPQAVAAQEAQPQADQAAQPQAVAAQVAQPQVAQPRAVGMSSAVSRVTARNGSVLTTNRMSGAAARATRRAGNRNVRSEHTEKHGGLGSIIGGIVAGVTVLFAIILVVVPAISSSTSDTQTIEAGQTVSVTIPEGSDASSVAQVLYDAKVIANKSEFLTQVSRLNAGSSLKSGDYQITIGNDLTVLIDQLTAGPNPSGISITIPEGYTVKRIAALVEQTYGISADEFTAQAVVSNYKSEYFFLEGASDTDSLEGFLFPKTYSFSEGATADGIIRTMLTQFSTELATLDLSYPESRGLSVAEMVNLASIVEKESTQSTGPQVAAVFYNRLGNFDEPNNGYLQSDATTAYTVGHDPTAEEVHDESDPYSTYTHQGLPPTPICCPGLTALQAVCSPDQTALEEGDFYFYFWNDADGNVQYKFSKTYEEHQQAIRDAQ